MKPTALFRTRKRWPDKAGDKVESLGRDDEGASLTTRTARTQSPESSLRAPMLRGCGCGSLTRHRVPAERTTNRDQGNSIEMVCRGACLIYRKRLPFGSHPAESRCAKARFPANWKTSAEPIRRTLWYPVFSRGDKVPSHPGPGGLAPGINSYFGQGSSARHGTQHLFRQSAELGYGR